jgi:hypothetical protein
MAAHHHHAHELPIPGAAFEDNDAAEIFRAWVINGGLQVSMQRAFEGPEPWGMLVVDIARHAARIFEREGVCSEAEALRRIKALFEAEWDSPTDLGTTAPSRQ